MLVLPIEDLPPELRDTYILLKGLQELPYEIQTMVLSHLDDHHDLLRLLKSLSRTTKQACMPFLHRTLSLPGKDVESSDWYSFMEILQEIAKYCRLLLIDPIELQEKFPIIKWSALLPFIVSTLSDVRAVHLRLSSSCGFGYNLYREVISAIDDSPALQYIHIGTYAEPSEAWLSKVSDYFYVGAKIASPRPLTVHLRGIPAQIFEYLRKVGLNEPLTKQITCLHLKAMAGPWNRSNHLPCLTTLVVERCRHLDIGLLFDMLDECKSTLEVLSYRQQLAEIGQSNDEIRGDPLEMVRLKQLSFELLNEAEREEDLVAREFSLIHACVAAPALTILGLGSMAALVGSTTISGVIERRMTEKLAIYARPLAGLAEEDEDQDAINPFSLVNQIGSGRADILRNREYNRMFYESP